MRPPRTLVRAAAALSTLAVGLAGTVALTSAPAEARVTLTDYGFQTHAWGTRVQGAAAGVQSGQTAFSYLACTRLTGLHRTADIAGADLPSKDNPAVVVGAVDSSSRTFRTQAGDVGTSSTTRIAKVTLGQAPNQIVIEGLRTTAKAWADKHGELHATSTYSSTDISGHTGTQLDDVLNQAGAGVGDLIAQIPADGQTIPGLGTLYVGPKSAQVHPGYARSTANVLRLHLDNPDSWIGVGRSWAQITRDLPAGVFVGSGWGAEIPSGLGNALDVGKLVNQPIPCQGTGGEVVGRSLAKFDPGNTGQLVIGGLSGDTWGVQREDGYAKGWTKGRVASLTLGPLTIKGVEGKALVRRSRSGKVTKQGTYTIGKLFNGADQVGSIPPPGQDLVLGDGTGHDVLKLRFGVQSQTRRSVTITAVRIEVLEGIDGAPVGTVIKLGNAHVAIRRN